MHPLRMIMKAWNHQRRLVPSPVSGRNVRGMAYFFYSLDSIVQKLLERQGQRNREFNIRHRQRIRALIWCDHRMGKSNWANVFFICVTFFKWLEFGEFKKMKQSIARKIENESIDGSTATTCIRQNGVDTINSSQLYDHWHTNYVEIFFPFLVPCSLSLVLVFFFKCVCP